MRGESTPSSRCSYGYTTQEWLERRCGFKDQYSLWHAVLGMAGAAGCMKYDGEIYRNFTYQEALHIDKNDWKALKMTCGAGHAQHGVPERVLVLEAAPPPEPLLCFVSVTASARWRPEPSGVCAPPRLRTHASTLDAIDARGDGVKRNRTPPARLEEDPRQSHVP